MSSNKPTGIPVPTREEQVLKRAEEITEKGYGQKIQIPFSTEEKSVEDEDFFATLNLLDKQLKKETKALVIGVSVATALVTTAVAGVILFKKLKGTK